MNFNAGLLMYNYDSVGDPGRSRTKCMKMHLPKNCCTNFATINNEPVPTGANYSCENDKIRCNTTMDPSFGGITC